MWDQFLRLINTLAPSLLPLLGVLLGWSLNERSQNKSLKLNLLSESFQAFREVRTLVENIPPSCSKEILLARLQNTDFRKMLSGRLVRLFGLRTELIPYLHKDFIDFIDHKFQPLYEIENGTYSFKQNEIEKLADACIEIREITKRIESELVNEYKKLNS